MAKSNQENETSNPISFEQATTIMAILRDAYAMKIITKKEYRNVIIKIPHYSNVLKDIIQ